MATQAHCAYAFEVLAADLDNRETLEYRQVLELWAQYQSPNKATTADNQDEQDATLQDGEADSEMTDAQDESEEVSEPDIKAPQPSHPSLRLPSISRLQAPSPSSASASTSSSPSTPSSLSATSSRVALGDASKSSSSTSFFSFGSRKSPLKQGGIGEGVGVGLEEEHPLFVTWNTIGSRGGRSLRGCIGTFEKLELGSGLRSYALTAAFDDTRFPSISLSELHTLSTSITLLTDFEAAANALDWEVGMHGIRISFQDRGKRFGATYLPNVAVEQAWTKEETLVSLMRKSGWSGSRSRSEPWRDVKGFQLVRYKGAKSSLDYAEFAAWREWVGDL